MSKPKVLITSAAGRTGAATVLQLLEKDFSVRAMVRKPDARSRVLEKAGAEVFYGDLFDFRDLRRAMTGVQRAYYCPPLTPHLLQAAMLFALAAEEAKLEVVALMSQWHPHPTDPSLVTREHWLSNQLYRWMPSVDVIHINPGLFAFIYMLSLLTIKHLGLFVAPFGEGRNAPPSNEDIASVIATVLIDPAPHIGKSYRPTGSELLSPYDIAYIFGKVLGRKVKYQDASEKMFSKAARVLGVSDFEVSQMRHYAKALRHGAYELGAPTDHFELITGRKPESFESITRRYFTDPQLIDPRITLGSRIDAIVFLVRVMFARVPDFDHWERAQGHPALKSPTLATDSNEWRASAEQQQLNILTASSKASLNLIPS